MKLPSKKDFIRWFHNINTLGGIMKMKRKATKEELKYWFIIANLMNLLDMAVTGVFITVGLREMNPAMNWLIQANPILFVLIKFTTLYIFALSWKRSGKLRMLQVGSGLLYVIVIWNIVQLGFHLAGYRFFV